MVSSNGSFDAYLLPAVPQLSPKRRRSTTVAEVLKISEIEPEAKMLHLLEGSRLGISICSRLL